MSFREKQQIIVCTSNALFPPRTGDKRFACWLHFGVQVWPKLTEVVEHLAENGCSLFHLSGPNAAEIHDRVDDVLVRINKGEILTSWSENSLREAAEVFWDVTATNDDGHLKVICVVASDLAAELDLMSEISTHLKAASRSF